MAIFPFFREISFAAFLISGILGSVNYYKSGNLDLKTAGVLSAGSFVGALAGVKINLLIPADTMKIILYLIVLLSGISILLRKDKPGNTEKKSSPERSVLPGTWCCNRCCLCCFRCRRAGAPGRTWHRCLCRKQKCNEKQPDAAETYRGCGFDCDRVHQTLSLIEKSALCTQTLVRSVSQLFLLTKYFLREYNIEKAKRRDTMQALSKKKTGRYLYHQMDVWNP